MPVRALRARRALAQDSAERPARVAAHACLMRCASRALIALCAYMCATWLAERQAPQRCCRALAYLARVGSREQGATLMCCASRVTEAGLAVELHSAAQRLLAACRVRATARCSFACGRDGLSAAACAACARVWPDGCAMFSLIGGRGAASRIADGSARGGSGAVAAALKVLAQVTCEQTR